MSSVVILLSALLLCILVFFKMKVSKPTTAGIKKSRMIPIFLAYLQVTWCVGAFKLQWPAVAKSFFDSAGVATASHMSFVDCFFSTTFYDQFLIMCSIPVIASLVPLQTHCFTSAHIGVLDRLCCRKGDAFHERFDTINGKEVEKGGASKTVLFFLVVVVMLVSVSPHTPPNCIQNHGREFDSPFHMALLFANGGRTVSKFAYIYAIPYREGCV
jgi:hypothetical protein